MPNADLISAHKALVLILTGSKQEVIVYVFCTCRYLDLRSSGQAIVTLLWKEEILY